MALTVIKPSGLNLAAGNIAQANIATLTTTTANITNISLSGTFYQSNLPLVLNDISNYFLYFSNINTIVYIIKLFYSHNFK